MPSRARLDEFIAAVVSGDHAGAIERFYTEDASMQENAAAPRVGRDVLVAHERAVLERVQSVTSTCVSSVVEGDRVIESVRTLMGPSDPTAAAPGTIRGDFARDWGEKVQKNLVHGSDSPESAEREIGIWFG